MSRQYVKDSAKYLNMSQLNALLANDGLGQSCEYSVETLWNRKSELAEKQADSQFDSYMASMFEAAQYLEACLKVTMRTAKDLILRRREAFKKYIVADMAAMHDMIQDDYDCNSTMDLYHDATFYCMAEKKFCSPWLHISCYDVWFDNGTYEEITVKEGY